MTGARIVVAGAGAVGCYVGGLLAAAGHDVVLLGRAGLMEAVARHGLTLSGFDGMTRTARPVVSDDPAVLAAADIVLVCVKSGATEEMARLITSHAPDRAVVVSLQNGVSNARLLASALDGREVRAGVVGFNVVALGEGRFHRSTSGEIIVAAGPRALAPVLRGDGALDVEEVSDIAAVQWGKLILNLTNAVNALSGLPLREMLLVPGWRRIMAAQTREAREVLKRAGQGVRVPAKAPGWAIAPILRLPTWAFRRVAAPMLVVDRQARTSMAVDLAGGRKTEVDEFQGEILRLAKAQGGHGASVPVNAAVLAAVKRAEEEGAKFRRQTPHDLMPG